MVGPVAGIAVLAGIAMVLYCTKVSPLCGFLELLVLLSSIRVRSDGDSRYVIVTRRGIVRGETSLFRSASGADASDSGDQSRLLVSGGLCYGVQAALSDVIVCNEETPKSSTNGRRRFIEEGSEELLCQWSGTSRISER